MYTTRSCGCKGRRTCLLCEREYGIDKPNFSQIFKQYQSAVFCPECKKVYPGWDVTAVCAGHPYHDHESTGIPFSGISVVHDFLTADEGARVLEQLDNLPWQDSQSGRRKQNFGPKTNFKKRKMQNGEFHGFPAFTKFIQERFQSVPLLHDFRTIEQCTLEYDPTKGASIDPHIDDCWVWGERVVTVNCCGDAVLTLSPYEAKDSSKYNLEFVSEYGHDLIEPLTISSDTNEFNKYVIRIPMPSLSLIVLYGSPRYQFEHSVLREDINERRVCIAYREFTPMFINGCWSEYGQIVLDNALRFWDHKTTPISSPSESTTSSSSAGSTSSEQEEKVDE